MFPTDNVTLEIIFRTLLLAPSALLWVIVMARFVGLRTFSKMTAFDFVITVATGSLMANAATATSWSSYWQATGAIGVVLVAQAALSFWRKRSVIAPHVLENEPLLLFKDGEWFDRALTKSRTTKADVWGKLREANVLALSDVRAVILETTGDISVLHGEMLSDEILTGVNTEH